ncbi:uncharacterized protein LOC105843905 isoform X1 [Hydra vulgaris]|uniref:Uncharacterized protein LOC105843905 isoform X1 n=2 Tax=Hydra vulgaris TaxID=6087 RepID=A0ABM4CYJ8_HYDVU
MKIIKLLLFREPCKPSYEIMMIFVYLFCYVFGCNYFYVYGYNLDRRVQPMFFRLKRYEDVDDTRSEAMPENYQTRSKLVNIPSFINNLKSPLKPPPTRNNLFDLYRTDAGHLEMEPFGLNSEEPDLLNINNMPSFLDFNEENANKVNNRIESYSRNSPQYNLVNKLQNLHINDYVQSSMEDPKTHLYNSMLLNAQHSRESFPLNQLEQNQLSLNNYLVSPTYSPSLESDRYINSNSIDDNSMHNSVISPIVQKPQQGDQIYPSRDLWSLMHERKSIDPLVKDTIEVDKEFSNADNKKEMTLNDRTSYFNTKNDASLLQNIIKTKSNEKDYKRVFDNETIVEYIIDDDKIINKTNDLTLLSENHGESTNDTLEFKNLLEEARKTKEQIDILSSKLEKDPEDANKVSNVSKKSKTDEESLKNDINVERGVRQLLVKHLIQVQIENHRKEEALETLLRHFPVSTSDLKTWNMTKGALKAIIKAKLTLLEPVVKTKKAA